MSEGAIAAAPAWSAVIALAGVALIAYMAWRFTKRRRSTGMKGFGGTTILLAVNALVLAVVAIMCATGLYYGAVWKLAVFVLVVVFLASILGHRDFCLMVKKARAGSERTLRHCFAELGVFAIASLFTVWAMECPYNDWAFEIEPAWFFIEYCIVLGALFFCYLISGRRGWAAAFGSGCFFVVGLSQYFVYAFKEAAIMPSDLLVLGTAAAVSGNYTYAIDAQVLLGAGFALAALCLLAFVVPWKGASKGLRGYAADFASACLMAALVAGLVCIPNYAREAGVSIDSWFIYDSYKEHGFLTSFIFVAQDMVVEKPVGYSANAVRGVVSGEADKYRRAEDESGGRRAAQEQFRELSPAVVCVMNETFSDLSCYYSLKCGYTGPAFYNRFMEQTITHGECSVSVIGGGTCNTEFEFLTNNNMAFLGQGVYPYSAYSFRNCENLAKQFNTLGYDTTAMHPNYPGNWSRDVIYDRMGFDTFLSLNDFPGEDLVHNEVSDAETYEKIIEILKEDGDPQFIMDVTMQNHSGYDRGGVPERFQVSYQPEGIEDEAVVGELNEYLGCIKASDAALERFISQLEMLDRPVVLVFFGDHQPGFSRDINDLYFQNESGAEHIQRIYQTSYFVWANYDVAGSERFGGIDLVSSSNLSALALEVAGVPLSDYQEMLLQERKTVPAFNAYGACDSEGAWFDAEHGGEPEEIASTLDLLERAQYERFVGKAKR